MSQSPDETIFTKRPISKTKIIFTYIFFKNICDKLTKFGKMMYINSQKHRAVKMTSYKIQGKGCPPF